MKLSVECRQLMCGVTVCLVLCSLMMECQITVEQFGAPTGCCVPSGCVFLQGVCVPTGCVFCHRVCVFPTVCVFLHSVCVPTGCVCVPTGCVCYHWVYVLPLGVCVPTGCVCYHWVYVLPLGVLFECKVCGFVETTLRSLCSVGRPLLDVCNKYK